MVAHLQAHAQSSSYASNRHSVADAEGKASCEGFECDARTDTRSVVGRGFAGASSSSESIARGR